MSIFNWLIKPGEKKKRELKSFLAAAERDYKNMLKDCGKYTGFLGQEILKDEGNKFEPAYNSLQLYLEHWLGKVGQDKEGNPLYTSCFTSEACWDLEQCLLNLAELWWFAIFYAYNCTFYYGVKLNEGDTKETVWEKDVFEVYATLLWGIKDAAEDVRPDYQMIWTVEHADDEFKVTALDIRLDPDPGDMVMRPEYRIQYFDVKTKRYDEIHVTNV